MQNSMDVDTFIHLMTPYDHDCGVTTVVSGAYKNTWTNAPYNNTAVLNEKNL
jgi:hypothetical protein